VKCHIWGTALCGVETGTVWEVVRKCLESFEMWHWRWMEKISWTDLVTNGEVLHRVKEDRNILQTTNRRKANWIGHMLLRNCLLKHVAGKTGGRI